MDLWKPIGTYYCNNITKYFNQHVESSIFLRKTSLRYVYVFLLLSFLYKIITNFQKTI